MADYSTVLERKQQSCMVQSWKYDGQALVNPTEQQSAGDGDWYLLYWNTQLLEVLQFGLMESGDT